MLHAELISILLTLIVGFATVIWKVSARSKDIDILHRDLQGVRSDLDKHENHCEAREKETKDSIGNLYSKISDNGQQLAVVQEKQEHMNETLNEIKDKLNQQSPRQTRRRKTSAS